MQGKLYKLYNIQYPVQATVITLTQYHLIGTVMAVVTNLMDIIPAMVLHPKWQSVAIWTSAEPSQKFLLYSYFETYKNYRYPYIATETS